MGLHVVRVIYGENTALFKVQDFVSGCRSNRCGPACHSHPPTCYHRTIPSVVVSATLGIGFAIPDGSGPSTTLGPRHSAADAILGEHAPKCPNSTSGPRPRLAIFPGLVITLVGSRLQLFWATVLRDWAPRPLAYRV